MFQTAPGVEIPFPEKILETYEVTEGRGIYANVSFEKLHSLTCDIYETFPEPLFLVLQLPLNEREEQKLGEPRSFHSEIMYLDGQSKQQIDSIIKSFGQLLFCDGMSQFGIASHESREEIFISKYKLVRIDSRNPRKFSPILKHYGLYETDKLITVWNTFSKQAPGMCRSICLEGLDVFGVASLLKQRGLYRAKIVED